MIKISDNDIRMETENGQPCEIMTLIVGEARCHFSAVQIALFAGMMGEFDEWRTALIKAGESVMQKRIKILEEKVEND